MLILVAKVHKLAMASIITTVTQTDKENPPKCLPCNAGDTKTDPLASLVPKATRSVSLSDSVRLYAHAVCISDTHVATIWSFSNSVMLYVHAVCQSDTNVPTISSLSDSVWLICTGSL